MRQNIIKEKAYKFSLRIIQLYQYIVREKKDYVISKQVLRSGTGIGALTEEALQAESRADFVHKLSIANKEANETQYWLHLLKDSSFIEKDSAESILRDCNEIIKLLTAIIKTTKLNSKK